MKKKLALKKDTLLQLTPNTLQGVHGGTSPLIRISAKWCGQTTDKIAGAATAVGNFVTALVNSKPADTTNISGRGECTA